MDAVRSIQVNLLRGRNISGLHHFVDVGGAEMLAGIAEFGDTARVADIRIVNHQVRRLIFLMAGPRVIEVRQLVEGELAIALEIAEQMAFRPAFAATVASRYSKAVLSGSSAITRPPPTLAMASAV